MSSIDKQQNSNQQTIRVKDLSNQFSRYYSKVQSCTTSIITFGNNESGKSTLIDLLVEAPLIRKKDPQTGIPRFYRPSAQKFEYPAIYFEIKQNVLLLEGLTTSAIESKILKINFVKKIFIQEAFKRVKNVAFVIIFQGGYDNAQKIKILQDFCQFLQVKELTENQLAWLKLNTFICFNRCSGKDREKDQFVQQENIHELLRDVEQDTIKEMLNFLSQQGRKELKKKEQQWGYIFQVQDELMGSDQKNNLLKKLTQIKSKDQALLEISKKLLLNQVKLDDTEAKQYIYFLHDNIQIFLEFIRYSKSDDRDDRQLIEQNIEKIKKKIFTNIKQLDLAQNCLQNISLLDMNIKIAQLKTIQNVSTFLQSMQKAYDSWYSKNKSMKKSSTLNQLSAHTIFLSRLLPALQIKPGEFEKINLKINNHLNLQEKSSSPKKILQNKNVDVRKPNKKKGLIDQFKESVGTCKNNFDMISKCIEKIEQKEKQQKYDFFESIYYIKMIKDLLICYRNKTSQDSILFVEEILSIYLFTDNFYEYELLLNQLIDKSILPPSLAVRYMQCMLGNQRYNACLKLIHYLMSRTFEDKDFRLLLETKQKCLLQMDEQYKKRCNIAIEPRAYKKYEFVKQKFMITASKIKEKEKDKQYIGLRQFMKASDFKLFLQ